MVVGSSIYDEDFKVLRMPWWPWTGTALLWTLSLAVVLPRACRQCVTDGRRGSTYLVRTQIVSETRVYERRLERKQRTFQVVTSNDDEEKPSLRDL